MSIRVGQNIFAKSIQFDGMFHLFSQSKFIIFSHFYSQIAKIMIRIAPRSLRHNVFHVNRNLSGFISVNTPIPANKKSLTKIVATIGPKSEQLPELTKVAAAGMKIMRINFSHATYEEADLRAGNITRVLDPAAKSKDKNLLAVMLDTQGPEIRTGMFANGVKELELVTGNTVTLSTRPEVRETQTENKIWISYKDLPNTARIGTAILLDDGAIELIVEKIDTAAGELVCRIANTGVLGNKKGVNIPGCKVNLPAMSDKDEKDIK